MSLKWLDRFEERIIMLMLAGATLIIFTAVMHRYMSGVPLGAFQDFLVKLDFSWAQELSIIMLVWMAKFGAAFGVRVGIHVGVDVLVKRLKPRNQRIMVYISLFAGALFTAVIAVMGAEFVLEQYEFGSQTPVLELPNWIAFLALPFASALMCFRFLQTAWNYYNGEDLPHYDHAAVEGVEELNAEVRP
jgi:C4-dicarboxylate transporter DctQ subunit